MEYESLEEKQAAFDAWKAGQGKPAVVPVKVKKEVPVAAAATKKGAFVETWHVLFLRLLAILTFAGGVILLISMVVFEKMNFVYMVAMVSCFFSGALWFSAAHALRLLEEMHWRQGGK
jgi:hypothetical protein